MKYEALVNKAIPIAKMFRDIGINVRANQKNGEELLFEIRRTKTLLTFSSSMSKEGIIEGIKYYLNNSGECNGTVNKPIKDGSKVQQGKYTCQAG